VLEFEERVLHQAAAAAGCERIAVPVDLREDWSAAVRAAGLDSSEPTAWLCEGLLIYLSAEEADQLLSTVSDLSVPGSQLAAAHGRAVPGAAASAFLIATRYNCP
jgi:methyltransferase (TIGR00027 family)